MNYRTSMVSLIPAIHISVINGFVLRVVAIGSMYATFDLTDDELSLLSEGGIFLQPDT